MIELVTAQDTSTLEDAIKADGFELSVDENRRLVVKYVGDKELNEVKKILNYVLQHLPGLPIYNQIEKDTFTMSYNGMIVYGDVAGFDSGFKVTEKIYEEVVDKEEKMV